MNIIRERENIITCFTGKVPKTWSGKLASDAVLQYFYSRNAGAAFENKGVIILLTREGKRSGMPRS